MKKRYIALALFFIFSLAFVSAANIESEAISNIVIPDLNHPAKFILTISDVDGGYYNLYTLTDVNLKPANKFRLFPAVKNEIEVYVYPREGLAARGYYAFIYHLNQEGGGSFDDRLTVKVLDLEDIITISSDSNDPETNQIIFYVFNKENIELENVRVTFSSIFFDDIEETFDLKPNEKKEFVIDVDEEKMKKITAGTYLINADFKINNFETKNIKGKIYLGVKKGIETETDSSGILVRTHTVTKINVGNVPDVVTINIKKDIISRLFTTFNIDPDVVERDGFVITYTWNRNLDNAETLIIKAKSNYIFPLIIILVASLLVWFFRKYTQTNINIKKSVVPVKTKTGHFALRVRLNVKARKSVENVSLIDRIPAIVKVYEKFGTIKPTKIDAKNRRIQWDIGDLNATEERVFSYIVYSKVGVIGKFSLPSALGVFERDGQIHEVESNNVFFLSEQTDKDED